MVFSSSIFLFLFFATTLAVYFFAREKLRNVILLLASLLFYAWGEPKNVWIMVASVVVNYVLGLLIEKKEARKKVFLVICVVYNIGVLFLFKYLNFAVDTWNSLAGANIQIARIALPIGISFFTFQIMSYVIDVYRKDVEAQKNIVDLALYISLFPQLIAGPIVRYVDVEKQIKHRTSTWERAYSGIIRFAVGFSKKILIADQLSSLVDVAFGGTYPSILSKWVGIIAYTLQIYFDFSGYSDMAIGIGKIFGFDFLENFNFPYISKSIQEFWRRWHISLSSWFRDYVYISLGGNRKGPVRTYINLFIVFFLTGLWHGASFNFIVWGLYYGVFMIIERIGWGKVLERLPAFVRHLYSVLIVVIGWVFFRADTLGAAVRYIQGMFLPAGNDLVNFHFIMNGQYWVCILFGIFLSVPHPKIKAFFEKNRATQLLYDGMIFVCFLVAICYMVGSGYSPFLYFRF